MNENTEGSGEPQEEFSTQSLARFLEWVSIHQANLVELNKLLDDDNQLTLYFRGVRDKKYYLVPSIYRQGWIENEDIVFNECLCRNPRDFSEATTTFDKLVKMQHYGVPTRLLDITTNPLVALYFACESGSTKASTGRVYVFYVSAKALKYSNSNTVSAVANLAVRPYAEMDIHDAVEKELKAYMDACSKIQSVEDIKQSDTLSNNVVEAFNKRGDVARLVNAVQNERPGFLPLIRKEHLESVWAVKPKLSNDRIMRQDGAFLLYGILGSKEVPLSIVSLEWARQCLYDGRMMLFLSTKGGQYKTEERSLFSEVQERHSIDSNLIDRFENKICVDEKDQYIGYDARMYLFSELQSETLSRVEELWETVDKIRSARLGERYFGPFLGRAGEYKTRSILSYYQLDSLLYLSRKVAQANFMDNVCRNEALIFCDSINIESKAKIAKEIEPLGMTRDKLFPELDDVAEYLKGKYAKKDGSSDKRDEEQELL